MDMLKLPAVPLNARALLLSRNMTVVAYIPYFIYPTVPFSTRCYWNGDTHAEPTYHGRYQESVKAGHVSGGPG